MPTRSDLEAALASVKPKLALGLKITHISYAIFLVYLSWLNFQSPENGFRLWLFKIIPLIIFIPGFIKAYYRAYSWLCFALLPYFIWIVPLVMGRGNIHDWSLTILIVTMFIASMMASRWYQQVSYLGWQIANTPNSTEQKD